MAHTKAGGKTRQQGNRPGKRLGMKVSSGERVKNGNVLVRQRGTVVQPGFGVKKGRDHTLYAVIAGQTSIKTRFGKKVISIS